MFKFKEKLNLRLKKMEYIHDLISYTTSRIHDEDWTKPKDLRTQVSSREHSGHTIVMRPWLTNHPRVYRLDVCDVT